MNNNFKQCKCANKICLKAYLYRFFFNNIWGKLKVIVHNFILTKWRIEIETQSECGMVLNFKRIVFSYSGSRLTVDPCSERSQ